LPPSHRRSFCERNQHHIRDIIYREGIIGGIISDMRDDYKTEIITGMPPEEEMLIVRLIFAVGLKQLSSCHRTKNWTHAG
jgi:hypothetical protein